MSTYTPYDYKGTYTKRMEEEVKNASFWMEIIEQGRPLTDDDLGGAWKYLQRAERMVTYWKDMLKMCTDTSEVDLDDGLVGLCACGNEYADTWCQNCHENGYEQENDPPRS